MSHWSSCYAIIRISTVKDLPNFKRILDGVLQQAPKITGSERDCEITYKIDEIGMSTSYPCKACPFYNVMINHLVINKKLIHCPGHSNLNNNQIRKVPCSVRTRNVEFWNYISEYQMYADIMICGELRDKIKEETEKEFKAFINHLKNFLPGIFDVEVIVKKIQ